MDKAGKKYWDGVWQNAALPRAVNPRVRGLNNYLNRRFHEYFQGIFASLDTRNMKLLEIGCARSAWLPYFAREFGFHVHGLDYSELGCQQARELLAQEKIAGEIFCADFFSPPPGLLEAFDVVVSFGVAEHFQDTVTTLRAFSRFLKPGGLMITNIPNLTGLNGVLQKLFNRPVFDIHVPLRSETLAAAHLESGLGMVSCGYFLLVNLGVVNIENIRGNHAYVPITRLRSWLSKAMWVTERVVPIFRPNRLTSPYINCVGQKPREKTRETGPEANGRTGSSPPDR